MLSEIDHTDVCWSFPLPNNTTTVCLHKQSVGIDNVCWQNGGTFRIRRKFLFVLDIWRRMANRFVFILFDNVRTRTTYISFSSSFVVIFILFIVPSSRTLKWKQNKTQPCEILGGLQKQEISGGPIAQNENRKSLFERYTLKLRTHIHTYACENTFPLFILSRLLISSTFLEFFCFRSTNFPHPFGLKIVTIITHTPNSRILLGSYRKPNIDADSNIANSQRIIWNSLFSGSVSSLSPMRTPSLSKLKTTLDFFVFRTSLHRKSIFHWYLFLNLITQGAPTNYLPYLFVPILRTNFN